jgi:hypothetical protein
MCASRLRPEGTAESRPGRKAGKWTGRRTSARGAALGFIGCAGPRKSRDEHSFLTLCIVLLGLDAKRLDYLGAQIDMYIGGEQEMYTLDTPAIVVCPPKFLHAPVITKKVNLTYGLFLICTDLGRKLPPTA